MGRIQTNIGLITGMPIGDTVASLMALEGKPRDMLVERTDALQEEKTATTELWATLLGVQYLTKNLGAEEVYNRREATSSNPDVLTADLTGSPPKGTYQFTPLRTVQAQQMLSSGFRSDTASLGGGKISFRFGDHVQRSAPLDLFNGGQGVDRGYVRITDRSGRRAVIDMSTIQTVDDVLDAINSDTSIDVTAEAYGDGFRLIDQTGETVSNLKVEEVGGGNTAASLGLAGIDVAASMAVGQDMIYLAAGVDLDLLNDGSGIETVDTLWEAEFTLRDGTTGQIDLSGDETTLGEILDVINAAAPGKMLAKIAPDGERLIVTDLTEGSDQFELAPKFELATLDQLGLWGMESVDGVLTGERLLGGTKTVLLNSLNGGNGFGKLGLLELTDRNGMSDTVSLAAAETLDEAIQLINAADVGIVAQVNQARNGLELIDTTGSTASNLIVASADGTSTAEKLGLAVDTDSDAVHGGDMHLQVVSTNTKLDDFNGGAGVARGQVILFDTRGKRSILDLRNKEIETIGDVISAINQMQSGITAEINETGDGIWLLDNAGGPAVMRVEEGNTTTGADLHLLGTAKQVDGHGPVIDGSTTYTVELDEGAAGMEMETTLAELNDGTGVAGGTFTIVDSNSNVTKLDLSGGGYDTVGDVIEAINALAEFNGVEVEARINDGGDGILLLDKAGGERKLRIFEGNATTAADLGILKEATTREIKGETVQVIDGSMGQGVHSLDDLRKAINDLDAGVNAMTFVDGSTRPFRLSLVSDQPGSAGEMVIDTSGLGFSFQETTRARDALLVLGEPKSAAKGVLISSSTNTFRGVLPGVTLQVHHASSAPVSLTIEGSDATLVANLHAVVDNYNTFREKLTQWTAYDPETDTKSALTGDATALRLDIDLSNLMSGRFLGAGSIQSLAEIGISVDSAGLLDFDEGKVKSHFASDPDALRQFFVDEEFGVSKRFDLLFESLSTDDDSLLAHRLATLDKKIADNESRIQFLNERLKNKQEQLFMQFYQMEIAIGKLQANMSALGAIQPIAPLSMWSD